MLKMDKLVLILWIITIHSFLTGVVLIIIPSEYLMYLGMVAPPHNFFQIQGGVFHIVMCVAYIMAALKIQPASPLILFIITAKLMAALFLSVYYIFIGSAWIILFSASVDGLMGLVVLYLYLQNRKSIQQSSF